jgi:hypothetical protein
VTLKAITFLGNPPKTEQRPCGYEEKRYLGPSGAQCVSPFVGEAIVEFYRPDALFVLSTSEGLANHFDNLAGRLQGRIEPAPVEIPAPTNEQEIWTFFQRVTEIIQAEDAIIFDVTLAFRSIPILALLAANLLRVARGTTVRALTYAEVTFGVYDAPVHDLSGLVRLMDWTTATDAFLKYGRADDLAALARRGDGAPLDELAAGLRTLTAGLQTSRPAEVQVTAAGLAAQIAVARADAATPAPIGLLLDRISAEYTPLGHPAPTDQSAAWEVLDSQSEIITLCVRKGLYVQAITTAREWLVSLVVAAADGDIFDDDHDRRLAESAINRPRKTTARMWNPRARREEEVDVPEPMRATAQNPLLREIWEATRDLRNDLSHTGMRRRPLPRPAAVVEDEVRRACARLPELLAQLRGGSSKPGPAS